MRPVDEGSPDINFEADPVVPAGLRHGYDHIQTLKIWIISMKNGKNIITTQLPDHCAGNVTRIRLKD
jgi:hypothetical protein